MTTLAHRLAPLLRSPVGIALLGLVVGVLGWFLLGSSIGLQVVRWQRCGDHPETAADPACQGPIPWVWRGQMGAVLLLIGAAGLSLAGIAALVRAIRRRRRELTNQQAP